MDFEYLCQELHSIVTAGKNSFQKCCVSRLETCDFIICKTSCRINAFDKRFCLLELAEWDMNEMFFKKFCK